MTESFKSFIMDDYMLCNTSTIWPNPNPYNPADCLLDALLNGNFNQIPAPLQECSLAPQLTSLADSSVVTATTSSTPSALYYGPDLIEENPKLESLIHVKSYMDLVQSKGDRKIPMASFNVRATSDLSTVTSAADCQDNLALRELPYGYEVPPLFTVRTAQTERTQGHQRNHNLFQDLRMAQGSSSKGKVDSGILPGLDILTCYGVEQGNQVASTGFMLHRSRLNSPSSLSVTENGHNNSEDAGQREDALREMIYRLSAMQPVNIDPSTIARPKRRNVRISKDPQSVAARHRREKISDRIRILQRLVPGGTKMDTASMLDEAIHYVKFLKRQVEVLESASSKLCDPHLNISQLGSYNDPSSSLFYPTSLSSSLNPNIASSSAFDSMSKKMFLHRGYSILD